MAGRIGVHFPLATCESVSMTDHSNSLPQHRDRLTRIASFMSLTSAALASWLYVKPRTRGLASNLIGYSLKIVGAALAPLIALMGLVGALLARRTQQHGTGFLGIMGALMAASFVHNVSSSHNGFERAFGPDWDSLCGQRSRDASLIEEDPVIPNPTMNPRDRQARMRAACMLGRRWQWGQVATRPRPHVIRNLAFAVVPHTDRRIVCDLWLPPDARRPTSRSCHSGIGVIYLHGGAWQAFDKDVATRPFFRHLCAQGHVVMDVAYRLARETDMRGMLGDVKRAIAWMKREGSRFGVNPERIVLAGASAGGHLALLSAYTPNNPDLDPPDVRPVDTSVRGAIGYYPVADLRTLIDFWSEQAMHPLGTAMGRILGYFPPEGYLPWSKLVPRLFGMSLPAGPALTRELLTFSPVAHVGNHCPPTLLLQGLHDHVIPVQDVQALHRRLIAAGRPSVLVELPQVEHAFDMVALQISPPAQAALYDVERFLALLA
jgi:acetyl esterase/lipase